MRREWLGVAGALLLGACGSGAGDDPDVEGVLFDESCAGLLEEAEASSASPRALVGVRIFCDRNLSNPVGQSCASCHAPSTGFTGPLTSVNAAAAVYQGASSGRFGSRKPPSAAYATRSDPFRWSAEQQEFAGGVLWDGRATGWRLGSPAAEQATTPLLSPVEQNLATPEEVVTKVCSAAYGKAFRAAFGAGTCTPSNVAADYDNVGFAIAAFEDSPLVNRYSSLYDLYLRGDPRRTLTRQQFEGMSLFEGRARCAECHPARPQNGTPPIFTEGTYYNLGLPRNPQNPAYQVRGAEWADPGLAGFLDSIGGEYAARSAASLGKHRVPTLRNVDKRPSQGFVKAYGHNGVFKSLKQLVHFYNTRDVLPRCPTDLDPGAGRTCWPAPEVEANLEVKLVGDLGLTDAEEDAIVALLQALSDE